MIVYKCDLCGATHDADIGNRGITYMDGAKLVVVDNKNTPCDTCMTEIRIAEAEAKARIIAKRDGTDQA